MTTPNNIHPRVINDLIAINNARIEGYRIAVDLAKTKGIGGMEAVFANCIHQSETFIEELRPHVELAGRYATKRTKISAKLYFLWMRIRLRLAKNKLSCLLRYSSVGENNFRDTYERIAKKYADELSIPLKNIIAIQLSKQRTEQANMEILGKAPN